MTEQKKEMGDGPLTGSLFNKTHHLSYLFDQENIPVLTDIISIEPSIPTLTEKVNLDWIFIQ